MDHERFDSWSKVLATKVGSRRGFVQIAALAAAGLGFDHGFLRDTEAKKRHRHAHRKHRKKRQPPAQPGPPDRPVDTRIVGGRDVAQGEYPFITALLNFGFRGTPFERQFCGGSLIGPSHVLTAAHCVDYFAFRPRKLPELRVLVDRTRLNDNTEGSFRTVAHVAIHPLYDGFTGNYDAAVLTLFSPIASVEPVDLVAPGDNSLLTPGTMLKVIGWGDTVAQPGNRPEYADILQEVELPVVADSVCEAVFDGYDPAVVVCAGGVEGEDSCFGDSGGPLFGIVGGEPKVVGIVSYGIGCASATPGAYAQVNAADIASFINSELAACNGIDTQTDRNNCGSCGNVCPRATTNSCVAGQCLCGSNPPCTGSQICNRTTGTCV